jgi:membrane associated rhomboid family serine protease
MVSGIIAGLFFVVASLIMGNIETSAVGASGAIFGLLGVLALLVPYSKVYLIAGPLIVLLLNVIILPFLPLNLIETWNFLVNMIIFVMIFSLFSFNPKLRRFSIPVELPMWLVPIIAIVPLSIISFFVELPIGNSAHFGGLVVGLIYALYLIKKFPNKSKRLRVHFR